MNITTSVYPINSPKVFPRSGLDIPPAAIYRIGIDSALKALEKSGVSLIASQPPLNQLLLSAEPHKTFFDSSSQLINLKFATPKQEFIKGAFPLLSPLFKDEKKTITLNVRVLGDGLGDLFNCLNVYKILKKTTS